MILTWGRRRTNCGGRRRRPPPAANLCNRFRRRYARARPGLLQFRGGPRGSGGPRSIGFERQPLPHDCPLPSQPRRRPIIVLAAPVSQVRGARGMHLGRPKREAPANLMITPAPSPPTSGWGSPQPAPRQIHQWAPSREGRRSGPPTVTIYSNNNGNSNSNNCGSPNARPSHWRRLHFGCFGARPTKWFEKWRK